MSLFGKYFGSVITTGEFEILIDDFLDLVSSVVLPMDYWKRIISEDIIGSLASSAVLARELPISNVGVKNIGSTCFTHQTLMPTEAAKLCFCMHIHHSCTRTINTNNAHKKECCCKLSFILLKRCRGGEERLKKLSRMMVAATCFSFYYCRTKLFSGKPILRFGAASFVFISVVLASWAALFAFFPA